MRFVLAPPTVLALDLGGTQIRAAGILADGSRVARVATHCPSSEGADAVIAACVATLVQSRDESPADVRGALIGIAVSAPGPLNPWTGVIGDTPNLGRGFRDIPIAASLESAMGLPAFLERDTNVAGLAEHEFGAARGFDDFVYLTVSTGVGGSVVTGGRLLQGPDGTAGELGHLAVDLDGPPCSCGALGHVEAICSGTGIARAAAEAVESGRSPFLAARAAAHGAVRASDVSAGEDAGDPTCHEIIERVRSAFAAACVGYVNVFNPSRIVVGGSVAEHQGDRLLGPARVEVERLSFRAPGRRVQIVPAELGPDVGLAGGHPLVAGRLADPAWRAGRPMPVASLGR